MPIHPWLIAVLLLAAGGAALAASFYWTVRRRDLTRRPEERQVGFGFKKTLLIYQPSNRGRINAIAWELARSLAKAGHIVTLNVPSPVLSYDPEEYDLLVFGGSAYLGAVGRPLKDYLSSLRFRGKQVLLFVVGDLERAPEMASLRLCVPAGNQIRSIKIHPDEGKKLCQFAQASV